MSIDNLRSLLSQADPVDLAEGALAYKRYNQLLRALAERHGYDFGNVVEAFVALSPNSDYVGNLRSLLSLLIYVGSVPTDRIQVSTYNHCKLRAIEYLLGRVNFWQTVKGPKIRNFASNILMPDDHRYVTIDGHMHAAWLGQNLTMKEAIIRCERDYEAIAYDVKTLAFDSFLIPNQLQAILWFTRKRVFNVKYDPQVDVFNWERGDIWHTLRDIDHLVPYPLKETDNGEGQPATEICDLRSGRDADQHQLDFPAHWGLG